MKKIKVLIVTEAVSYGGNNVVAINLEKHLDKNKFECVYCVRRDYKGAFEEDAEKRGIRVIHVPDSELNYFKSYKFYNNLLKKEHFDIVHCHLPFFSGIVLMAAKKNYVQKRIAHSHFSHDYTDTAIYSKPRQAYASVYRKIMRRVIKHCATDELACSREAGEFLFGKNEFKKNGTVLYNGIETEKFKFNNKSRLDARAALKIDENAVVFGHVGLMYGLKNQKFVIDIFNAFHKKNKNSCLLLIGDGVDREMLENKAKELDLFGRVLFLGNRKDVEKLYCAMDCFVFPSWYEGFPLTLIEAQMSGLSCIVSDTVTKSVKYNKNVEFVSLDEPAEGWADKISGLILGAKGRENVNTDRLQKNFDIENAAKRLEKIYLS